MGATVINLCYEKKECSEHTLSATMLIQQYHEIFRINDICARQVAYAVWHAKVMQMEGKIKK